MSLTIDLNDIQGDIIFGIPKRVEDFIFFIIADVVRFKQAVGNPQFMNLISTSAQIQVFRQKIAALKAQSRGQPIPLIPHAGVNIAFTQSGLNLLGLTDDIADPSFKAGQLAQAQQLGDGHVVNGIFDPAWRPEFMGDIHGIILIAGDSTQSINEAEATLTSLLGNTVSQVLRVSGQVRPGDQKGHEHFGYMDGISSPAVDGVETPLPGQQVVAPGILLMGQPGDDRSQSRPSWAHNGSLLVYRHLDQLVPEFDQFKRDSALSPQLGVEKGAELLGARLFGRWKSGAPIDIAPTQDDPVLATDPLRNNNFNFSKVLDQTNCPFAAHIRKTNPRSDLPNPAVAPHSIHRTGIPFGEEVTDDEKRSNKTQLERGLAFVCYQSTLVNGFEFMQGSWANNLGFPPRFPILPGFDPIIGQTNLDGGARQMVGYNPQAQLQALSLPFEFVVSKGGAYFFSPSISTLRNRIGNGSVGMGSVGTGKVKFGSGEIFPA